MKMKNSTETYKHMQQQAYTEFVVWIMQMTDSCITENVLAPPYYGSRNIYTVKVTIAITNSSSNPHGMKK